MTEAEVLSAMREHLENLFPKNCPNCERRFPTLREYLKNTSPLGQAIPFDAERGDWHPVKPRGSVAFFVCSCNSTMALSSDGMPLERLWSLMDWAKIETERRGVSPRQLLNYLRDELCKQILGS